MSHVRLEWKVAMKLSNGKTSPFLLRSYLDGHEPSSATPFI